MRPAVVTTTIFVPVALDAYFANAVEHGHQDTLFVVTGDRARNEAEAKTQRDAKAFCEESSRKHGVECIFMDSEDQTRWLENFPELKEHLPWNCIQRRNISLLVAYQKGCDPIITIDDDNYVLPGQDFVGDHISFIHGEKAGREHTLLRSTTNWVNICDYLEEKKGFPFYARGYPMRQRWLEYPPVIRAEKSSAKVVVNAGLWLDDPDLDAITRLCNSICAVRYTREENFSLGRGTWSPFNSQNTAIAREAMEAYWLSPVVGRYDDIWGGYLINRIADHFGHEVSYGFPLVKQERNPHNYFVDHRKEEHGLELTDKFCAWLRDVKLSGESYFECFEQLLPQLQASIDADAELKQEKRDFLNGFVASNRVFLATMKRLKQ